MKENAAKTDADTITETIAIARREAARLKVSVKAILACWRAGYAAGPVIEFARQRGMPVT